MNISTSIAFIRRIALGGILAVSWFFIQGQAYAQGAAPCGASFDPYQYAPSALTACGLQVYPLQQETALPGGGEEYVYDLEGHRLAWRIPPVGFDPVTASAAQLREYFIPGRPADPTGLADWNAGMKDMTFPAPPAFLVGDTGVRVDPPGRGATAGTQQSSNWSGYVTTKTSAPYEYADARWYEPSLQPTQCYRNAMVDFVGLGGVTPGAALGQIGTGIHTPGLHDYQAFWEVLPDKPSIVALPLVGAATVQTHANLQYDFGGAYWFHIDVSNGPGGPRSDDFTYQTTSFNGDSPDYILERPTINGNLPPLTSFYVMTWNYAVANTPNGSGSLGQWPNNQMVMWNYQWGYPLATPGNLYNGGQSFYIQFNQCQ